jgi:hypothetical protein
MIDKLLTDDLAVLARDHRQQLPTLEATLRVISPSAPSDELLLVAVTRLYVRRVARLTSGAVLLGCAAIMFALACFPFGKRLWSAYNHGFPIDGLLRPITFLFIRTPLEIGVDAVVLAIVAGVIAMGVAERRVEREIGRSGTAFATVQALARGVGDRSWIVLLGGVSVLLSLLATPMFELGLGCTGNIELDQWAAFTYTSDERIGSFMTTVLANTGLAVGIAVVGWLVVARGLRRGAAWVHALERPIVTAGGVLLACFVACLGFRFSIGDVGRVFCGTAQPATGLRIVMTVGATLSVLLASASLVLRRRRRELDQIR